MTPWLAMLASVAVVSSASFIAALLLMRTRSATAVARHLVALAVGALYGDAFLHLLPEAIARWGARWACAITMIGLVAFFLIEKGVRRGLHHRHHHPAPAAAMNLVADTLHNVLDGLVIGGSYAVSLPLGLTTTVAVVLHELPQELGDLGVLVHSGMHPRHALRWNVLVSLGAVTGGVIGIVLGAAGGGVSDVIAPVTAGTFLYLAGSDLIPELHDDERGIAGAAAQLTLIAAGVAIVALVG